MCVWVCLLRVSCLLLLCCLHLQHDDDVCLNKNTWVQFHLVWYFFSSPLSFFSLPTYSPAVHLFTFFSSTCAMCARYSALFVVYMWVYVHEVCIYRETRERFVLSSCLHRAAIMTQTLQSKLRNECKICSRYYVSHQLSRWVERYTYLSIGRWMMSIHWSMTKIP